MPKIFETTLEVDLNALTHNYWYLYSHISKKTKFMGVVKAFGYGNDSARIAQKLVEVGVDYLGVSYEEEGENLRNLGIRTPILVFHPQLANFERMMDYKLMPSIYSKSSLEYILQLTKEHSKKDYPIHLVFNTGMNRIGFNQEELNWLIECIKNQSSIKIEGIYSHFAVSNNPEEKEFTESQITLFKQMAKKITNELDYQPLLHLCNTSGILNYPEAHLDMVRAGIGLYGFGNSPEADNQLKPVGSLKTVISQIHHIRKGESVGYNRSFVAMRDTQVAVLPLGYADGLHRHYGNGNSDVRINGESAPIIGDICMGITMVDATGIDCKEGDEVLIFGTDKSAEDMAQNGGTISYELITTISKRVKRLFIE